MRLMKNVVRESVPLPIKESLNASWKEGVVAQVMISVFDYYLIPYALFLGATVQQVGLLVAIPNFLASISQFYSVRAVDAAGGSRRSVMVYSTGIQALLLIPVVLLSVIDIPGKIPVLIALITVYRVLGSLLGPAWGSLVSNYLPEGQRGQYFGWRQRMVGIAGVVGVSFWGSLLYLVRKVSPDMGFVVLFGATVLFRFTSFYFMRKMVDIPMQKTPGSNFTFWMFIARFRESNFVRFILYVSTMTFAVQLAVPYFSVHMLNDLHFSYLSYMSVHLSSVVAGLIAYPLWGRASDIVGNAKILKSTALLMVVEPLLWTVARHPVMLIAVELFAGFVLSGFTLATTNFIYDAVSPPKRVRCLGYYNIINGMAIFLAASLGGYLADRLPPLFGYSLGTLFLISAVLRFFADFALSRHFKEVRATARTVSSSQLYLSVVGIRPLAGTATEPDVYPDIRPPRSKWKR